MSGHAMANVVLQEASDRPGQQGGHGRTCLPSNTGKLQGLKIIGIWDDAVWLADKLDKGGYSTMSGCGRLAKVRKTNERERAPRSRRRSWPRLDSRQGADRIRLERAQPGRQEAAPHFPRL